MSKVSRKLSQKMNALSEILSNGEPELEGVMYSDERRKLARKSKLIKVKKKSVILIDEDGKTLAHLTLKDGQIAVQAADNISVSVPLGNAPAPASVKKRKKVTPAPAFQGGGQIAGEGPDLTRKPDDKTALAAD